MAVRANARLRRARTSDAGMSLLEVVIAMAIFAIGVTAILGIFVKTGGVAGDNIRRTTAANLVNQQLEAARSLTAQQIPSGRSVTSQVVGNITYTITQTAGYLTSNAVASVCSSTGSALAYKLVRVSVTWTNMGQTKPVTGDVLRAVGVGSDDAAKGTLAVLISGATGLPMSGVAATLVGSTAQQTTGDDGCVVFTGLDDGNYSVSVNQTGYVGTANTQIAQSAAQSVAAGAVSRGTLLYATSRTLNYVFDAPVTGYVIPSGLPIRIGNTYLSETTLSTTCTASSTSACLTGVPGTLRNLFPEKYTVKAGTCVSSDPSQGLIDIRSATADNSTVAVPMGAVTVTVKKSSTGAAITGRTVTFTSSGCSTTETYTVASGSTLLLPYGTWNISVPAFSLGGVQLANATGSAAIGSSARSAAVTITVAN
ncbi:hypothetical protein GCM10022223_65680 [Kineosporia mesophila]|uniref:alpha-amylase n=1 Tax=Kineosporia mesophila TaxID=566012 RepID=A0ABP7APL7_9ACTN